MDSRHKHAGMTGTIQNLRRDDHIAPEISICHAQKTDGL